MSLSVINLSAGYNEKPVIEDINFEVNPGDFLCILGPNGSGKTTLFKTLLGLIKPISGKIDLGCDDTFADRAKKVAYIPQSHAPVFNYNVIDYVLMGRTPHIGKFSSPSKDDERIAYESLETLGIERFSLRGYATLSGGERQLVQIAKALTQRADVFVMDEPTSALDYGNQFNVMREASKLAKRGMSVIMTSHNPNHALHFANKSLILYNGRVIGFGDTDSTVTGKALGEIYGIDIRMIDMNENDTQIRTCVAVGM